MLNEKPIWQFDATIASNVKTVSLNERTLSTIAVFQSKHNKLKTILLLDGSLTITFAMVNLHISNLI